MSNAVFFYQLLTINFKNTSGDSKAKVCRWIGQTILPELYDINVKALGERVKSKIDS